MQKKLLLLSGGTLILTLLFVLSYVSFNALDMTHANKKLYQLTIVTEGSEKVYDGFELSNDSWFIESGVLDENHSISVVMPSRIVKPGSIKNEIGVTILDQKNNNITENYLITYKLGDLTVNRRSITVQTVDEYKFYDGIPLTSSNWELNTGSLPMNHHIESVMNSSIIEPGSIQNEIGITIFNDVDEDVTDCFNINYIIGNLTVHSRSISVETSSIDKIYDGTPLFISEWTLRSGSLPMNHRMDVLMSSNLTNPGTINNDINVSIFNEENVDVTHCFNIEYYLGSLTVHPRPISIQTVSAEKIYDGEALSSPEWIMPRGEVIEGHRLSYVMSSSITNPGSINNAIGVTIYDALNQVVTHYYTIDFIIGQLTVHQRPLSILTGTDDKVYDGTALIYQTWYIQQGILITGHEIVEQMPASIIKPGSIENSMLLTVVNQNNQDVTAFYNISLILGSLTVYPREVTIQTLSAEKMYDDTPLTKAEWTMEGTLALNHYIDYRMEDRLLFPGSVENNIELQIYNALNEEVTMYYEIAYEIGTLTVHPIEITIQTLSAEKVYDGTELSRKQWVLESGGIYNSHNILVNMPSSLIAPGVIQNEVIIQVFSESNVDVTQGYEITYHLGSLTVLAREITIRTSSAEKIYDGTSLTDETWEILVGSVLPNHTLVHSMPSSITNPGSTMNEIILTIKDDENNDVLGNYDITYLLGQLKVLQREISILTMDAQKSYDGTTLQNQTWELESGLLLPNHHIQFYMPSSIINPGSILNEIGVTIIDENNEDVTSKYAISYHLGSLVVEPIEIILRSLSDVKVYDGLPLSRNEWELIHGTLLEGHEINVIVDGEITDIGEIDNNIYAYATNDENKNVNSFYHFEYVPGTLTILTSTYGSGDLSMEPFEPSKEEVFKFLSSQTANVYFRDISWGDYNKKGWYTGVTQSTDIDINPLTFPGQALLADGKTTSLLQMEYIRDYVPYLLPYFSGDLFSQLNDVKVLGSTTGIVNHNIISYQYNASYLPSILNEELIQKELIYRTYVYEHYLVMPETTRIELLKIAAENGLDPLRSSIVTDVQSYITSAATYNLEFEKIPDSVQDIALYFLTVSKEGICQHFATAGTLMYRAMGIPARYVTGYVGQGKANEWKTVTGDFAHAWVEIYLDGFGWMPIEVTGGGAGSGGESPYIGELVVKPKTVKEIYEPGKTIYPTSISISGFSEFLTMGYTYEFILDGELSTPGRATSIITSLTIYDPEGVDVTDQFDIDYRDGILQLYEYQITLFTGSNQKVYDGTILTNDDWYIEGVLQPNHTIEEIMFTSGQTQVGLKKNMATLKIIDEFGQDVTSIYNIIGMYGNLIITPRAIQITSNSATKIFDGTSLTDSLFTITEDSLVDGHSIEVSIIGSQTAIGKSVNTIDEVIITYQGVNVTRNYSITVLEGELSVTPN